MIEKILFIIVMLITLVLTSSLKGTPFRDLLRGRARELGKAREAKILSILLWVESIFIIYIIGIKGI